MDFERDDAKAAVNLPKHGVAFEDAMQVFLDPARVDLVDARDDYGEERWLSLGWWIRCCWWWPTPCVASTVK